jgi:hypothetical protein
MAFLHEGSVRARAARRAQAEDVSVEKALGRVSREQAARYDIFLSQTIRDAAIVLGVYDLLTAIGYLVFCDWIDAPDADRTKVTPANAALIRHVMSVSDTLLFLDTEGADQSLWMCWEVGWFDGVKGHVGVLPVLPDGKVYYRGREFLGLYPYIELDEDGQLKIVRPPAANSRGTTLFEAPNSTDFDRWRKDAPGFMRPRVIEHWGLGNGPMGERGPNLGTSTRGDGL